jgi:uncharacterized protein (TIGR02145 family)
MKIINKICIYAAMITGIFLIISISCNNKEGSNNPPETGSYTDPRDGRIYKTVKIGEQWIMAENFAYKPKQGNCWAYNNDSSNVDTYGYLYDWETAKKVAPEGWHLPSRKEWKNFRKALGGRYDAYWYFGGTMEKVYKKMVDGGSSGFNALFGGIYIFAYSEFNNIGECAYFWSSTDSDDGPWYYALDSEDGTACLYSYTDSRGGKSVRFFKD